MTTTRTIPQASKLRLLYCEGNVDGTVGGSYFSLLYLVKGLDKARYDPTVVFYSHHGLVDAFRGAGARVEIWEPSARFAFATRVAAEHTLRRLVAAVAQKALNLFVGLLFPAVARAVFLVRRRVDVVHLNNSILRNHDWMLAARWTGRACITHERGINDYYPPQAISWGRRLDAIVCISEAVQQSLCAAEPGFTNLVLVPNGFDAAEVRFAVVPDQLRRSHGIGATDDVVVMVGNIKAWKGQDTLLRALHQVRRTRPQVRCVLVGATSPDGHEFEASLRELTARLALDGHVVFAGYRPNVADYLRMADVVVHASTRPEPFGRVLLEAMACRKPVIGSRAGGVLEIIDEGRSGLTFPPGDADALAAALLGLLNDPATARALGEAGYTRLHSHFGIQQNVAATEKIYRRLERIGH